MIFTQVLNKFEGRLKREFLQIPIVSNLAKKYYNKKLSDYKSQLPVLNTKEQKIVDTLRQEGTFVTTLDQLSIPNTTEAVNVATNLLLKSSEFYGDLNSQAIPGYILRNYPEILLWGLDNRLLDIIENYIGLPIFYLGAEVKRELPNGKCVGVRKWHLDTEDYRMVKIIIYLNDVDEQGGPFQYIPRNKSDITVKDLGYKFGLISEELMNKYIPRQDWISCVGEQYIATIVDTACVFHRAKPPINKERHSITFHYTSQYPIHLRSKDLSISTSVKHIYTNLSKRQLKCLFS